MLLENRNRNWYLYAWEGGREGGRERQSERKIEEWWERCLRQFEKKLRPQGKWTVESIRVFRDTSSCQTASASLSTSYKVIMSLFVPRSVSQENPTETLHLFLLWVEVSIVTKWNKVPSTSLWPTIESYDSKC